MPTKYTKHKLQQLKYNEYKRKQYVWMEFGVSIEEQCC